MIEFGIYILIVHCVKMKWSENISTKQKPEESSLCNLLNYYKINYSLISDI